MDFIILEWVLDITYATHENVLAKIVEEINRNKGPRKAIG